MYKIWFIIAVIILAAILLLAQLKYVHSSTRGYIIGPENNSPILSMINIIFSWGIVELPKRNFARTVLIIWIAMSLILRSAYQGRLYHFMQMHQFTYLLTYLLNTLKEIILINNSTTHFLEKIFVCIK